MGLVWLYVDFKLNVNINGVDKIAEMSGNLIESRQSISRNYFHIGRTSQCHHPTPMQVVWPVCSESVVDSLERPTSTQETGVHIPSQIGLQDIGKKVTL